MLKACSEYSFFIFLIHSVSYLFNVLVLGRVVKITLCIQNIDIQTQTYKQVNAVCSHSQGYRYRHGSRKTHMRKSGLL